MTFARAPAAALAWLGRQGTRAVALSLILGVAVPGIAAPLKPIVPEMIFVLLCLAFLRVSPALLWGHVRAPALTIAATAWTMLAAPAAVCLLLAAIPAASGSPEIFSALTLQAVAPPLTAAPAFAALLGLDAALSLAILVASMIVTPFAAPALAALFLGTGLSMSPVALGGRLFLLLSGAAIVASAIRGLAGGAWVDAQKERIDGLNVIVLFAFAVALMDGVGVRTLSEPLLVLGLIAAAFGLTLVIVAVTTLVFLAAGRARAFTIGLAAGSRNLGVMLAATGGAVPDLVWLYFALAQFPIYLMPQFVGPIARHLAGPADGPPTTSPIPPGK